MSFNSETDSEVIAQLIEKLKKEGLSVLEAIQKTERIMADFSDKPQWGIVAVDKEHPDKMWTSTKGSPILIGMNDDVRVCKMCVCEFPFGAEKKNFYERVSCRENEAKSIKPSIDRRISNLSLTRISIRGKYIPFANVVI